MYVFFLNITFLDLSRLVWNGLKLNVLNKRPMGFNSHLLMIQNEAAIGLRLPGVYSVENQNVRKNLSLEELNYLF